MYNQMNCTIIAGTYIYTSILLNVYQTFYNNITYMDKNSNLDKNTFLKIIKKKKMQ